MLLMPVLIPLAQPPHLPPQTTQPPTPNPHTPQDRRRQLLYLERRMQRRLVNEVRAQARELDPILRTRGRM